MKNYLKLNLSLLYWVFVAPFGGEMFKISPIFRQMVFIGVRAAPMVALTAFSVGVTLAMQAAHSLQQLGAVVRAFQPAVDGKPRNTAYFTILADEWPRVKQSLESRLTHSV